MKTKFFTTWLPSDVKDKIFLDVKDYLGDTEEDRNKDPSEVLHRVAVGEIYEMEFPKNLGKLVEQVIRVLPGTDGFICEMLNLENTSLSAPFMPADAHSYGVLNLDWKKR